MAKENPRDADIRSVIGVAHEVRLRMHDSRVIFGSVVSSRNPDSFVVRPWGVKTPTTIRYDDVRRVASVTEMVWQRQKAISQAQLEGIFEEEMGSDPRPNGEPKRTVGRPPAKPAVV